MNNNAVISLDDLSKLNQLSRAEIERIALTLQSNLTLIDEGCYLRKLKYLIEKRLEVNKEPTAEYFIETFEGSTYEKLNGFQINLKQVPEYDYSDKVKDKETELELLRSQITQMKEQERKNGIAKKKNVHELLAFTLK
jgi:hypothetical protein